MALSIKPARQNLALLIISGLLIALIYSKFALTVGMMALLALALFHISLNPKFRLSLNPDLTKNLKIFWKYKPYAAITLLFLIVIFSGLYSEDNGYYLERLRIKLPFLLLPFAFAAIPPFSMRQIRILLYVLLAVMFFGCIDVGVNYLMAFDEINESIRKGKSIPTPNNHIRFSLILAFTILSGLVLYFQKVQIKYKWERPLVLFITVFHFIFIHILSVRSGLLALYLALGIIGIIYGIRSRKYLATFTGIILLGLLPFLVYQLVPSFKNKIDYTIYDLKMHLEGKGSDYSDSERIVSLNVGMEVGNRNPIIGVGAGDLKREVHKIYEDKYPQYAPPKMPHNQLVSTYGGMGAIGVILFLFAFFYPLIYRKNYKNLLFLGFHVIVFTSFMMENTLENAVGVAFYAVILLTGLSFFRKVR